jgi:hypothetical protein
MTNHRGTEAQRRAGGPPARGRRLGPTETRKYKRPSFRARISAFFSADGHAKRGPSRACLFPCRSASVPLCLCGSFVWVCVVGLMWVTSSPVSAQSNGIETDPIRCWWKTDRGAIRVGERFTIALTCGVIETAEVKVVPTMTQLDPGALQIPPFEVVGGKRGPDLTNGPRRYFQYEYSVRLIGEGFFGQDVNIPPLSVTYNIQSTAGQGSQGRDQMYVLPAMPMRVQSLVPREANDIRDASPETFSAIDARRFRATTAFTAAAIVFAFAGVLVVLSALRVFGRVRQRKPRVATLPASALLGGSMRALRHVKSEVMRDGWTAPLARRASTALRIAAAVALDRRVAQQAANGRPAGREGQIAISSGLIRRRRVLVSASTTPMFIGRQLENGHRGAADRQLLERLQSSLDTFTTVAYGRNGELDRTTLDAALDGGTDAVRRLRVRRLLPSMPFRKEQWASS